MSALAPRHWIWISAAMLAALAAAGLLATQFGKSDQFLRLRAISGYYRVYEYNQVVRSNDQADGQSKTVKTNCEIIYQGRGMQTGGVLAPLIRVGRGEVQIDGLPRKDAFPRLREDMPTDFLGRPVALDGRPAPYSLEMLSSPDFFPFLSGRRTRPGEEWEHQFRLEIPRAALPMIVVMRTRLDGFQLTDSEWLSQISFRAHGEVLYRAADGAAEQAKLEIQGQSRWNAEIGMPYSLKCNLILRVYDFEKTRLAPQLAANPNFAVKRLRMADTTLTLLRKTQPSRHSADRRSAATPAGDGGSLF
ncbi:MAG: hypothetical protein BWZ10_01929 [candidate division BRC1 bacterium ADurb.BinA364]|nr:MAG: hypothetical protein BWZ10_01929 [candidate division BRC1 bacterium ADurb.BinA364]